MMVEVWVDSRSKTLPVKKKEDNAGDVNVVGQPNTCRKTQGLKGVNEKVGSSSEQLLPCTERTADVLWLPVSHEYSPESAACSL